MPQQFFKNPLEQFEPEKLPVGWPWRLLSVALVLFLASFLTYLGLIIGYEPYLNSKIAERETEISNLARAVSEEDQENFIKFYSQISNLKGLLDNHVLVSKIFPLLEGVTNKQVYYSRANLDVERKEMELEGVAKNYGVLGEQLEAFNQSDKIERFLLNESQVEEGVVRFKATLILGGSVLK